MEEKDEKKVLSRQQEEHIAKMFGGRPTSRSGAGPWDKLDVTTDDIVFECKCTVKPSLSYSVNKAVLDKADHERAEMHKPYYALAFQLGENREDYFVVNTKFMKDVVETRNELRALAESIQAELDELDKRYKESQTGIRGVDDIYEKLYRAHSAEKRAFLEQLLKI